MFTACQQETKLPKSFSISNETLTLYPDYKDITIPPNISPLNFAFENPADAYIVEYKTDNTHYIVAADKNNEIRLDSVQWQHLLASAVGSDITIDTYKHTGDKWLKTPSWSMHVATDSIDPYLYYRLIEPGYELYRQLGIYCRNLQNDNETAVYENNREFDNDNNHCVNCHNFQNYDTQRMLFHVRASHGGTMMLDNGHWEKLSMKTDSMLSGTVYPTWYPNPKYKWVVFSSNKTGQAFHMTHPDRIEVVDYGSDLVFYDAAKHKICNIFHTDDWMETFPCWAPSGRELYFCASYRPEFKNLPLDKATDCILAINDSVYYNIYRMTFDAQTMTFGKPKLVVDVASKHLSASLPRISSDGKYLLYTVGRTGQFHIWHKSSDLWVKNLQTGKEYPLKEANSNDVDSYHSWSSNGRWIVFASRRIDGNYSRPFISYFDSNGNAHKSFALPHNDPYHDRTLLKSYNIPELTRNPLHIDQKTLRDAVYDDSHNIQVSYDAELIHKPPHIHE